MTTVTISDELRIKLKRLAAKYDTTQAEIIRRAVALLENQLKESTIQDVSSNVNDNFQEKNGKANKIDSILEEARENFEIAHPTVAKIHEILRENMELLDEATISSWEIPFEE